MALKQALSLCDPSSVDELLGVYLHFNSTKQFEKQLVACLADNKVYQPATWLLKHHLEQGFLLSDQQTQETLDAYLSMEHWEARLHVLQCFGFFIIPHSLSNSLYVHLRHQLSDDKKFIRAWTYSALHEMAQQFNDYHDQVRELLLAAEKEEVASVTARIRKILKSGSYD